jgi:Domain of unknown function (DUF3943)
MQHAAGLTIMCQLNVSSMSRKRCREGLERTLLTLALTLTLMTAGASSAEEPSYPAHLKLPDLSQPGASAGEGEADQDKPVLSWETGAGKSYLIPALEIVGFEFLLNQFDRHFIDDPAYDTSWSSIKHNFNRKWVVDNDPFSINQFGHPYQGSMYHGFARSAGLNYWESLVYTFAGSALWEIAGETTAPSKNDQVATGIGGTFLGEPLFRMSNLVLESADGTPSGWRELGAAVISPPTGFNRLAFGERFDTVFPSRHPAYFSQLQVGGSYAAHYTDQGVTRPVERGVGNLTFALAYGLPGKADYAYTRPFDYFDFEVTASTANVFENIMSRGLLIGTDYAIGSNYRGVWGLYGSYDYISPQTFRISSTALSLGTTAQWWLSQKVALQGTALGGVGYGAAGTIHGQGERDYHYGLTPQALLALKMIFGQRVALDLVGRDYFVSRVASTEARGSENILRGEAAATMRIYGRHALSVKYVVSHREASYPDLGERHQTLGTVWLFYTLLGNTRFGTVEWRSDAGGP